MFRLIISIALLAAAAQAQVTVGGGCPTITSQSLSNLALIHGTWYEQFRYSSESEVTQGCGSVIFDTLGTTIKGTFKNVDEGTKKESGQTGTGTYTASSGSLTLTFSWGSLTYNIVRTDFLTYMVLFDCRNNGGSSARNLVIWTRRKFPEPATISYAFDAVANSTLDYMPLKNSAQYRCPYPRF